MGFPTELARAGGTHIASRDHVEYMRKAVVPSADPVYIQTTERFHHVQIRPSDAFTEYRTPLAADTSLSAALSGCDIREGRVGPDQWAVESVLIPVDVASDGRVATRYARQILAEVES